MRKYIYTLLFAMLLFVIACTESTDKQSGGVKQKLQNRELVFNKVDTTLCFKIDTFDKESPKLEIRIKLDTLQGDDAYANKINNAIVYAAFALDSVAVEAAVDSFINILKEEYYAMRPDYINEKDMEHSPAWMNFSYDISSKIISGLKGYYTYCINHNNYFGGAHGSENISMLNIDAETGNEVHLGDIFKEGYEDALTQLLIKALMRQTNVSSVGELMAESYIIDEMYPTENFCLDKDSIIFIFNSYEIAPYSMGHPTIKLGYNELKELMK